jgi:hypothetical protein
MQIENNEHFPHRLLEEYQLPMDCTEAAVGFENALVRTLGERLLKTQRKNEESRVLEMAKLKLKEGLNKARSIMAITQCPESKELANTLEHHNTVLRKNFTKAFSAVPAQVEGDPSIGI